MGASAIMSIKSRFSIPNKSKGIFIRIMDSKNFLQGARFLSNREKRLAERQLYKALDSLYLVFFFLFQFRLNRI